MKQLRSNFFIKLFLVGLFFSCERSVHKELPLDKVETFRICETILELNKPLSKTFFETTGSLNSLGTEGCNGYSIYSKKISKNEIVVYYLCRYEVLVALKIESEKGLEKIIQDNSGNSKLKIKSCEENIIIVYSKGKDSRDISCINLFFENW